MFETGNNYWFATRFAICRNNRAYFGIKYASDTESGYIGGKTIFDSQNGEQFDLDFSIRPIITIKTNIQIYGGDGSEEHPYQLSK